MQNFLEAFTYCIQTEYYFPTDLISHSEENKCKVQLSCDDAFSRIIIDHQLKMSDDFVGVVCFWLLCFV